MSNIIIRPSRFFHAKENAQEAYIERIRSEWIELSEAASDIWDDDDEKTHDINDRH